jgi:hypothetical protein
MERVRHPQPLVLVVPDHRQDLGLDARQHKVVGPVDGGERDTLGQGQIVRGTPQRDHGATLGQCLHQPCPRRHHRAGIVE